jgi:hypothetical protein
MVVVINRFFWQHGSLPFFWSISQYSKQYGLLKKCDKEVRSQNFSCVTVVPLAFKTAQKGAKSTGNITKNKVEI